VYQALTGELSDDQLVLVSDTESRPFEKLFYALVAIAEEKVIEKTSPQALALFNDAARTELRAGLLKLLTDLYAPLLYGKFVGILKKHSPEGKLPASTVTTGTVHFDKLVEDLRTTELGVIFTEKPVLLRLTATIVRQWIETTAELINRLYVDIEQIRAVITHSGSDIKVQKISGDLSDPHNFGHSVQILTFEDQTKLVYKPKDLRLDVAWCALIVRFNASSPPVDLKPVRTIACHEYG
jgi:lantibiotic modifying enzyme